MTMEKKGVNNAYDKTVCISERDLDQEVSVSQQRITHGWMDTHTRV